MHNGLYVVGGRQRDPRFRRPEWKLFDEAAILHVDPVYGSITQVAHHVSPPEACAWTEEPSILFKASTRVGNRLYACTSTEVLVYSVPEFQQLHYFSHRYFNDLHHVTVDPHGQLVVVNTGLDMVLVMSDSGDVLAEYSVGEEFVWTRFSKDIDYRKVLTTKPHKSHPNYAFFLDGSLWVTRLEERDAICLTEVEPPIKLRALPHDGIVRDGKVYFTTVDGHILIFSARNKALEYCVDLNTISGKDKALGWCRGLEVMEPGIIVAGFTKLRRTRFHEKLIWAKERFSGELFLSEPTRIAAYDLVRKRLLWEIPLDCCSCGLNAIFAIHRASSGALDS
jgi:hypothetical protein